MAASSAFTMFISLYMRLMRTHAAKHILSRAPGLPLFIMRSATLLLDGGADSYGKAATHVDEGRPWREARRQAGVGTKSSSGTRLGYIRDMTLGRGHAT